MERLRAIYARQAPRLDPRGARAQLNQNGPSATDPPRRHLVLAGGGHTHALVLRMWAMQPARRPAATWITLVSRQATAFYSGMVPGLVAGQYAPSECAIDLRRLCARAGVTFVRAEIDGLDPGRRELRLQGRPPLRYGVLSLDVGAVSAPGGGALAIKPLEPFLAWAGALPPGTAVRIRGGGAAAVEVALALRARGMECRLLLRGHRLRLGSPAAERAAERLLAQAGIPLERQVPAEAPADLACTGSRAPAWLAAAGLPVDPADGRVLTEASLAVVGHPELFASGDCGTVRGARRPPSGVWAVRAAPVLAENLRLRLEDPQAPLRPWRPQQRALQLLGDGGWHPAAPRAMACWGPLALGPNRWLWRWKQHLDRAFLERFAENPLPPAPSAGGSAAGGNGATGPEHPGSGSRPMACRGCAAKLAAAPLAAALARLDPLSSPTPEDAAPLVRARDGALWLQSVDGFPALVEDPWLNARLTTLHACSDLWASGATVRSAQALVTVPEAAADLQEELLLHTLAGLHSVLDPLGARLIGGHTLEARDGAGLALALTVNGSLAGSGPWPKGPLRPGDTLVLSRAIGSGVLFAAARAGAAEPAWIDAALEVLQQSQAPLVELLAAHGCHACTDITGFGLLGHLGEMLGGQPLGVVLEAEAIPALRGARELLERGFCSSLSPSNAAALTLLAGPVRLTEGGGARRVSEGLLIDPQTCGPLLAALPAERATAAVADLHRAGFRQAAVIGRITAAQEGAPLTAQR